jgi:hypothetical protein
LHGFQKFSVHCIATSHHSPEQNFIFHLQERAFPRKSCASQRSPAMGKSANGQSGIKSSLVLVSFNAPNETINKGHRAYALEDAVRRRQAFHRHIAAMLALAAHKNSAAGVSSPGRKKLLAAHPKKSTRPIGRKTSMSHVNHQPSAHPTPYRILTGAFELVRSKIHGLIG